MKNLHTISVLLMLLSACNEYHYIPDNMKFKYNEGDTLIFKSNTNTNDSFFVSNKRQIFEVHDKQYYHESENIYLNFFGQDTLKKVFFINNFISLSMNGFLVTWGDFKSSINTTQLDSIVLNGTIFKDVFQIERDTNDFLTLNIYKIYFSRNYGVLKYWYRDNKEYEFYKVLVH